MPLAPKLNKYSTASPVIATFDFQDIATGENITTYYAATTKFETTTGHILTGNSNTYSDTENTNVVFTQDNDTVFRKQLDVDFDLSQFQITQVFEGQATIQLTRNFGGSSADANGTYHIFKIRKWDGSTETEVASVQTETLTDDTVIDPKTDLLPITIPNTTFAVGETLRLTMEVWTMNDSSIAIMNIDTFHDPVNRNGTATNPHSLILNMPQKVDL